MLTGLDPVSLQFVEEYKGSDFNTSKEKSCSNIECETAFPYDPDGAIVKLKCSRCRVVHYCSKKCQKVHFPTHRAECKEISDMRARVSALNVALRGGEIPDWDGNEYVDWSTGVRIDYFSPPYLGNWWGHLEPRDYCRAVHSLSELIRDIAWDSEVESLWMKCLNLKLDLLRCNISDNQGIRSEVPYVLLYLNKDDECLRFIKWSSYNYRYKYARGYGHDSELSPVWEEGLFVYDEAGGDRFDDIFPFIDDEGVKIPGVDMESYGVLINHCVSSREVYLEPSFLVALIVIKLRIVVHLEVQLHLALKENSAADTTSIGVQLAQQKRLLDKYHHMIYAKNKYILHIFGSEDNLRFMIQQGSPRYFSSNSPEEAFFLMKYYTRHIARIPMLGSGKYGKKFLQEIGDLVTPDLRYSL